MIIDGKKIANDIIVQLEAERTSLPPVLRLGVLMGAQDAASASFVKIKERVADKLQVVVVREMLDENSTTDFALRAMKRLESACAGIIVQLPLPPQIELGDILAALPPEKDVDALGAGELLPGATMRRMRAPVAEAVSEVLVRTGVVARGKKATVIGAGKLVGMPVTELLRDLGAEVTVVTQNEGSLLDLKNADIVVLGAGDPGFVKPEMLKEGAVLIDAGTSASPAAGTARESGGKLAGDADPRCAEVASVFTPVPGGIGPIAVAMIFKNLFTLAKLQKQAPKV